MSRISVSVECRAGSDIHYAIVEMIQLADRLGIDVEAKMNSVKVIVHPGDDPQITSWRWDEALKEKSQIKIAVGEPCKR